MRSWLVIMKYVILSVGITFSIVFCFVVFNKAFFCWDAKFGLDPQLASQFGDFVGGFIGSLFAILSVLVVAYSILKQTCENRKSNVKNMFFQMIDYHYKNLDQIEVPKPERKNISEKGKRGFVAFKIQMNRLLQALYLINEDCGLQLNAHDIASIAYMVFYYGLSESWKDFFEEKIRCYECRVRKTIIRELLEYSKNNPEMRLCQANHTVLSAYFRNMYNAIKLIDTEAEFKPEEKRELIKIYRAQLSNPELYILFFNVISPFGKKWRKADFIKKYSLLKNIPEGYLDGYNPRSYFDITYEYEEINCSTDDDGIPAEQPHKIPSSTTFASKRSSAINKALKSVLRKVFS